MGRSNSSAVLEAPRTAVTPSSPLEAGLAEAYRIEPEGTLAALQRDVDSASTRLEAIATGADRHGLAGRLRAEIRQHGVGISNGQKPTLGRERRSRCARS